MRLRHEKDDRAAAQFAGEDLERLVLDDDLGQRHLRLLGGAERRQHLGADRFEMIHREGLGQGGGHDVAFPVQGEAPGWKVDEPGFAGFE